MYQLKRSSKALSWWELEAIEGALPAKEPVPVQQIDFAEPNVEEAQELPRNPFDGMDGERKRLTLSPSYLDWFHLDLTPRKSVGPFLAQCVSGRGDSNFYFMHANGDINLFKLSRQSNKER